jgi:type IV secretion system protein VirB9
MKTARTLLIALALGLAPLAHAAEAPRPGVLDPRIQTVEYDPDQVVVLRGTLGYQFMLEFAPDEHIETVSIGDSVGWQVTPNRKANVLFIKPVDATVTTNLTVLSDQRRYAFELTVAPRSSRAPVLYIARMVYPQPALAEAVPEPPPEAPPTVANAAYGISGAADSRPLRVFDDGQQTYFEWPADSAVPAIFAVSASGAESLVNSAVRGPYTVVEQLAPKFMLRNGAAVTTVVNQAYVPQVARSPQ